MVTATALLAILPNPPAVASSVPVTSVTLQPADDAHGQVVNAITASSAGLTFELGGANVWLHTDAGDTNLGPTVPRPPNGPTPLAAVVGDTLDLPDPTTLVDGYVSSVELRPVGQSSGPRLDIDVRAGERYIGAAGNAGLVAVPSANTPAKQTLVLRRTGRPDTEMLSGQDRYAAAQTDSTGAIVVATDYYASPQVSVWYVDYATGQSVKLGDPVGNHSVLTPSSVGWIAGPTLTTVARTDLSGAPTAVTLPTDQAQFLSGSTLAWEVDDFASSTHQLWTMPLSGSAAPTLAGATSAGAKIQDKPSLAADPMGGFDAPLANGPSGSGIYRLVAGTPPELLDRFAPVPAKARNLAITAGRFAFADTSTFRELVNSVQASVTGPSIVASARTRLSTRPGTPSPVIVHGSRTLVADGSGLDVFDGTTLINHVAAWDPWHAAVTDFDGRYLSYRLSPSGREYSQLMDVTTGTVTNVPYSALDGGYRYSLMSNGDVAQVSLSTGASRIVAGMGCPAGTVQARGDWVMTQCGYGSPGFLKNIKTQYLVSLPVMDRPELGAGVIYHDASGILRAFQFTVDGTPDAPLFTIPGNNVYSVDREGAWAGYIDGDGLIHIAALGRGGLPAATSHDFNGDRHPDVIARSTDGALHLYTGNGSAITGSRVVGTGWNGLSALFTPDDANGDGHNDLIGRTPAGDLTLYSGNGTGFTGPTRVGTGWNGFNALFSPGDWDGDGNPDVIGRTSTGDLYVYYWNGVSFTGRAKIGTGWNGMTAVFSTGNFTDGDTHPDIIARSRDGVLHLYSGNGVGITASRVIGVGWNGFTMLLSPGDFNSDGYRDVIGRTSAGDLFVYYWNGTNFTGRTKIGVGWNGLSAVI